MGQVVVKVNGRDFALSCADGQEPRIRRLAQYVDAKIGEFAKNLGQVGEARLILLAALVIADELSDANEALQQERLRTRPAGNPAGEASEAAASGIRGIAERIEAIAERIETA
jgi:cell division protein ZapA